MCITCERILTFRGDIKLLVSCIQKSIPPVQVAHLKILKRVHLGYFTHDYLNLSWCCLDIHDLKNKIHGVPQLQSWWKKWSDFDVIHAVARLGNKHVTTRGIFCHFSKFFATGLFFCTQFCVRTRSNLLLSRGKLPLVLPLISQPAYSTSYFCQ